MKIVLANAAHPAIGSRMAGEPLIDAGRTVRLLDGDFDNVPPDEFARQIAAEQPDARRRAAMRWHSRIGPCVRFAELFRALVTDAQARQRTTVAQFWANNTAQEEAPLETIRFLPARAHTTT